MSAFAFMATFMLIWFTIGGIVFGLAYRAYLEPAPRHRQHYYHY